MPRISVNVGMRPGWGTKEHLIHRMVNNLPTGACYGVRVTKDDRHTEPVQVSVPIYGTFCLHYRLTYEMIATAIHEWSEQALEHIEDTPDRWVKKALAVQAEAWSQVDADGDEEWTAALLRLAAEWYAH